MLRSKKVLALIVVCSMVVSGCIGSFAAFNKLLSWNHQVSDQPWVNEAIFLGLNIIPVYGLTMLGDMLIFNSVEFWTGKNPMAEARMSRRGDHRAIQMFSEDHTGKHMTIAYYSFVGLRHTCTIDQSAPSAPLIGHVDWIDGRMEDFSVQRMESGLVLYHTDSSGQETSRTYSANDLEPVSAKLAGILGGMRIAQTGL